MLYLIDIILLLLNFTTNYVMLFISTGYLAAVTSLAKGVRLNGVFSYAVHAFTGKYWLNESSSQAITAEIAARRLS